MLDGPLYSNQPCFENAFLPSVDEELALAYTVSDPIEVHVNGFRSLLFDSVVGDTSCSAVVGLDR